MRNKVAIAAFSLVVLLGFGSNIYRMNKKAEVEKREASARFNAAVAEYIKQPCEAKNDQLCPPEQFLADFNSYDRLQKEVINELKDPKLAEIQAKNDQAVGIRERLEKSVPPGYQYDPKLRVFVKILPPNPVTAPEKKKK